MIYIKNKLKLKLIERSFIRNSNRSTLIKSDSSKYFAVGSIMPISRRLSGFSGPHWKLPMSGLSKRSSRRRGCCDGLRYLSPHCSSLGP